MDYGQTTKPEKLGDFDPALKTNAGELVQAEEDENQVVTKEDVIARLKRIGNTASNLPGQEKTQAQGEAAPAMPPNSITSENQSDSKQDSNENTPEASTLATSEQDSTIKPKDPVEIAKELEEKIDNPSDYYEAFQKTRDSYEGGQKND